MMTVTRLDQEIKDARGYQLRQGRASSRVGVLVVDDDRAIRETLRYVLEDADYPVCDAADGIAALDILRRSTCPFVVLLDLMMPRLDGARVLRAVGDDALLASRCACIVLTANVRAFTSTVRTLLLRLDAEVVLKPFDLDVLLDAVDRAARRLYRLPRDGSAFVGAYSRQPALQR